MNSNSLHAQLAAALNAKPEEPEVNVYHCEGDDIRWELDNALTQRDTSNAPVTFKVHGQSFVLELGLTFNVALKRLKQANIA